MKILNSSFLSSFCPNLIWSTECDKSRRQKPKRRALREPAQTDGQHERPSAHNSFINIAELWAPKKKKKRKAKSPSLLSKLQGWIASRTDAVIQGFDAMRRWSLTTLHVQQQCAVLSQNTTWSFSCGDYKAPIWAKSSPFCHDLQNYLVKSELG